MFGCVPMKEPLFLVGSTGATMRELFFIKKGGKAFHPGTSSKFSGVDTELICISNQDKEYWIGNYALGLGLCDVHFAKKDCRKATSDEVKRYMKGEKIEY